MANDPKGDADTDDERADEDDRDDDDEASSVPPPARALTRPGERLRFARGFPQDDELLRLVDAFAEGNYALVRLEAPALAKRTDDPAVARAARDLASRLDPDPLAIRMLVGAGLLLLFLVYWFYSDQH